MALKEEKKSTSSEKNRKRSGFQGPKKLSPAPKGLKCKEKSDFTRGDFNGQKKSNSSGK